MAASRLMRMYRYRWIEEEKMLIERGKEPLESYIQTTYEALTQRGGDLIHVRRLPKEMVSSKTATLQSLVE
jgi:hypothetical protein